jgi:hypothetical protein
MDIRSKCKSLWSLYRENRHRGKNYRDVTQAIISGAGRARPVAWMTPGHPLVFDSVSQNLLKAGRSRHWNVAIVPGISCIDTILSELGYDPAGGLLIHEATSFVMRKLKLQTEVSTMLLQPSAFDTDVAHYVGDWRPDLSRLRDYLLRFHQREHACAFVHSSQDDRSPSQIYWTPLCDLASVPTNALRGSTLFLPAA